MNSTMSFSYNANGIDRFTSNLGDPVVVKALLLELRKFFADGEDTQFNHIANIVNISIADLTLAAANSTNRRSWKNAQTTGGLMLVTNGIKYTPRVCFDTYVNGEIFHTDREAADRLASLDQSERDILWANVNELSMKTLRIINAEMNLINQAFENEYFKFS